MTDENANGRIRGQSANQQYSLFSTLEVFKIFKIHSYHAIQQWCILKE
jgi:hypothetical protein